MKYKVIDNFLDEKYFEKLVTLFKDGEARENIKNDSPPFPWYYIPSIVYPQENKKWKPKEETDNSFYMSHLVYNFNSPISPFYNDLLPLLQKIGIVCLMRIKANLFPIHILYKNIQCMKIILLIILVPYYH